MHLVCAVRAMLCVLSVPVGPAQASFRSTSAAQMREMPPWFQCLVWMEVFLQLPFFFVGAYAFALRRNWIRTPAILYGINVASTMVRAWVNFEARAVLLRWHGPIDLQPVWRLSQSQACDTADNAQSFRLQAPFTCPHAPFPTSGEWRPQCGMFRCSAAYGDNSLSPPPGVAAMSPCCPPCSRGLHVPVQVPNLGELALSPRTDLRCPPAPGGVH